MTKDGCSSVNTSTHLAYNGRSRGHQNRKVCQVTTAAGGVGVVWVCQLTALRWPAAIVHGINWVVPKGTLGPVLIWELKNRYPIRETEETIRSNAWWYVFKAALMGLEWRLIGTQDQCWRMMAWDLFFCSRPEIQIAMMLHFFLFYWVVIIFIKWHHVYFKQKKSITDIHHLSLFSKYLFALKHLLVILKNTILTKTMCIFICLTCYCK